MKWNFLNKECDNLISKGLSNTQIAKNLLDEYEFDIRKVHPKADKDTIRMYVSKRRKLYNVLPNTDCKPINELWEVNPSIEEIVKELLKSYELRKKIGYKDDVDYGTNPVQPVAKNCNKCDKENYQSSDITSKGGHSASTPSKENNTRKYPPKQPMDTYVMQPEKFGWESNTKSEPQLHLILGCIHVPFENKILLNKIFQLVKDNKFTSINLIGDVVDCSSISSYSANNLPIDGLTLQQEYEAGIDLIAKLNHSNINYIPGNHELRVIKYNLDIKNAKTPVESFGEAIKRTSIADRVEIFNESILIGSYELIHGIYYNEHCAKKHVDALRKNVIFAHTHRIQSYVENNIAAYNIGFLGQIDSPAFHYADRGMKSKWRNGFGILVIDGKNEYFHQITCDNNSFYFNGRSY